MDYMANAVVTVATDAELLNEHYYRRLWISVRNMGISRRDWLDELSNCLISAHRFRISYASGEPFQMPFVDEVMGDDPENRWMSDFTKADPTGSRPKARSRKLERVRMIDLYFRMFYPEIARHFDK